MMASHNVVVIGGGIAGTTCVEYISSLSTDTNVMLIVATDVIKTAATTQKISRLIDQIDVSEKEVDAFVDQFPNVSVHVGVVTDINCDGNLFFVILSHDGYSVVCSIRISF